MDKCRPLRALFMFLAILVPVATAAGEVIELDWSKTETGAMTFVWEGSVEGDLEGDLTTMLVGLQATGPILHVEFLWLIDTGDEETSFTACASGILNTRTGRVVMNGEVCEGAFLGRKFHDEGQLTGVTGDGRTEFAGSIRLMPNE